MYDQDTESMTSNNFQRRFVFVKIWTRFTLPLQNAHWRKWPAWYQCGTDQQIPIWACDDKSLSYEWSEPKDFQPRLFAKMITIWCQPLQVYDRRTPKHTTKTGIAPLVYNPVFENVLATRGLPEEEWTHFYALRANTTKLISYFSKPGNRLSKAHKEIHWTKVQWSWTEQTKSKWSLPVAIDLQENKNERSTICFNNIKFLSDNTQLSQSHPSFQPLALLNQICLGQALYSLTNQTKWKTLTVKSLKLSTRKET